MNITQTQLEELHPLEVKVLLKLNQEKEFTTQDIVDKGGLVLGQANQVVSWLTGKKIIKETSRTQNIVFELTELGKEWKMQGSPIEQLFECVKAESQIQPEGVSFLMLSEKLPQLSQSVVGAAFGILSKEKVLVMNKNKNLLLAEKKYEKQSPQIIKIIKTLLEHNENISIKSQNKNEDKKKIDDVLEKFSKKKGAGGMPFRKTEREIITFVFTKTGVLWIDKVKKSGLTGLEVNALTPQMLKDNTWQNKTFRPYNITSPPNRVNVGKENVYANFLRSAKDKLVALGFEEIDGPLVETEFWNSDALFMPQFHAARNIHDVYYIQEPTHAKKIQEPYLTNVAQEHEKGTLSGSRGWQYSFDKDFTRRLILRSQGTVMSAKTLRNAKTPGKYFGVLRIFRHDQIDATHLSDFYQTEGIILGDDVNIKTLLGLLKIFAEEFAHAEEVRYVPGYFPFTEPSIEVHIKHATLGWMELGGSGIFRPEVTKPLGIDVPVAAWGIGIDRMAIMQMNIDDIRDLFSYDIKQNALRKKVKL